MSTILSETCVILVRSHLLFPCLILTELTDGRAQTCARRYHKSSMINMCFPARIGWHSIFEILSFK